GYVLGVHAAPELECGRSARNAEEQRCRRRGGQRLRAHPWRRERKEDEAAEYQPCHVYEQLHRTLPPCHIDPEECGDEDGGDEHIRDVQSRRREAEVADRPDPEELELAERMDQVSQDALSREIGRPRHLTDERE